MPRKKKESTEVIFPLSEAERRFRQDELARLVDDVKVALKVATDFADKYRLAFYHDVAYGMGGRYEGDPEERGEEHENGWYSSSNSC